MQPNVSVIVPAYNVEKYIGASLDSLIGQTLPDIQIICVDDCSTDKTPEIIEEKARQNKNIVFIRLPQNMGVSRVRNEGLKRAGAEYVMFCDGDDLYHSDMCRAMYEAMLRQDADIAVSQAEIKYDIPMPDSLKKSDLEYHTLKYEGLRGVSEEVILNTSDTLWNKIFKKSIIDKYEITFPEGLHYEDAYFTAAYFAVSKNAFFIKRDLYTYVRREGSIMTKTFEGTGRTADHIFIAFKLYDFLERNSLLDKYGNLFQKLFFNYYKLAVQFSPEESHQKIWDASRKFIEERGLLKKFPESELVKSVYENKTERGKTLAEKIFSVKNSPNRQYKIITILGFKIKIRRRLK